MSPESAEALALVVTTCATIPVTITLDRGLVKVQGEFVMRLVDAEVFFERLAEVSKKAIDRQHGRMK